MAQTVLNLPRTTLTMDEGRIVSWLVQPGDFVDQGSPVAELETDKAVIEIEAPVTGKVAELLVDVDQVIPLGAPLAVFVDKDEEYQGLAVEDATTEVEPQPPNAPSAPLTAPEAPVAEPPGSRAEGVRASPAARRLARAMGVNLREVTGSGPAGRVLRRDIEAHQAVAVFPTTRGVTSTATPAPGEAVAVSAMRRAIARNMTAAWLTAPQFSLTRYVDMSAIMRLRAGVLAHFEARGARVSVTDFIVQAVSQTLLGHPLLNAGYDEGHDAYVHHAHVGMGLAVAVGEDGLVVPVIHAAERLSLVELAHERTAVTAAAQSGRGRPDLFEGGTFTISNLGTVDVDHFRAIVMPGQSAILALGAIKEQVVAVDGAPQVRPMMAMTVTLDHRVVDGMAAAQFMRDVVARLESETGWILY